jgi:hypothetical protein
MDPNSLNHHHILANGQLLLANASGVPPGNSVVSTAQLLNDDDFNYRARNFPGGLPSIHVLQAQSSSNPMSLVPHHGHVNTQSSSRMMPQHQQMADIEDSSDEENEDGRGSGTQKKKTEKAKWTPEEDEKLRKAVSTMQGKHWRAVANFLPGKTEVQCLHRWTKVLNPNLTKGPWTPAVSNSFDSTFLIS